MSVNSEPETSEAFIAQSDLHVLHSAHFVLAVAVGKTGLCHFVELRMHAVAPYLIGFVHVVM